MKSRRGRPRSQAAEKDTLLGRAEQRLTLRKGVAECRRLVGFPEERRASGRRQNGMQEIQRRSSSPVLCHARVSWGTDGWDCRGFQVHRADFPRKNGTLPPPARKVALQRSQEIPKQGPVTKKQGPEIPKQGEDRLVNGHASTRNAAGPRHLPSAFPSPRLARGSQAFSRWNQQEDCLTRHQSAKTTSWV